MYSRKELPSDRSIADAVVIDVRERYEFAAGHIPEAASVPLGLLDIVVPPGIPDHQREIQLYSNNGLRSREGLVILERLGYENVTHLEGGLRAWMARHGAPRVGWAVEGKEFGERQAATGAVAQIDASELAALLEDETSPLVLDVRSHEEHIAGHIPTARSVPLAELLCHVGALIEYVRAGGLIVTHCAGRTRGLLAADMLRRHGVDNVVALQNGCMGWRLSGRSLDETWVRDYAWGGERGEPMEGRSASLPILAWDRVPQFLARVRPYIVDVRGPEDFARVRLRGAASLPLDLLPLMYERVLLDRSRAVVVIGDEPRQAAEGLRMLREVGFDRATYVLPAYRSLPDDALPVDSGPIMWGREALAGLPGPQPASLSAAQLIEAMKGDDTRVIDVRSVSEFARAHVPGAAWCPRGKLLAQASRGGLRGCRIVVVSTRGLRALLLAARLLHDGLDAQVLSGGMTAWRDAGLATEDGAPPGWDPVDVQDDWGPPWTWSGDLSPSFAAMEAYLSWEVDLARDNPRRLTDG